LAKKRRARLNARPKKVDLIGKKATRQTQRATEKGRFDWQKKAAQNNRIRPKTTGFGSKSGLASRQLVRGHASYNNTTPTLQTLKKNNQ
jgi:hypothetical protein